MHARESGVVDHLATSDEHAIALARQSVAAFAAASGQSASSSADQTTLANGPVDDPVYDPKELGGVTGTNLKKSWDMREVIARTVDGSRFAEWKREWGDTVVTGFGESSERMGVGEPSAFEHAARAALLTRVLCPRLTAEVHGHQVGIVSETKSTLRLWCNQVAARRLGTDRATELSFALPSDRQQRRPPLALGPESDAVCPAMRAARRPDRLSRQHHRLHGRNCSRKGGASLVARFFSCLARGSLHCPHKRRC